MVSKVICWQNIRTNGYGSFLFFHLLENKSENTMNLENFTLSEIRQSQKDKHLYEVSNMVNFAEAESRAVVAKGWRKGAMRATSSSMGIEFRSCKINKF